MAGAWRSTIGDVDRGGWVGLGDAAGVGSRGAWAALAAGLDNDGREVCALGAAVGASIGRLAGAVGRPSVSLGAAWPSMSLRVSLGMRVGGTWAFILGSEVVEGRIGEAGGGPSEAPAGGRGGRVGEWCSSCPGGRAPPPSIEMGGPSEGGGSSTVWLASCALGAAAGGRWVHGGPGRP